MHQAFIHTVFMCLIGKNMEKAGHTLQFMKPASIQNTTLNMTMDFLITRQVNMWQAGMI